MKSLLSFLLILCGLVGIAQDRNFLTKENTIIKMKKYDSTAVANAIAAKLAAGDTTVFVRKSANLSDLANAGTARTNLGLGTLATQSGTFSGTSSGTNTGDQTTITGNAGTATALQTPRTINGVSFNGTADILLPSTNGKTRVKWHIGNGNGTGVGTVGWSVSAIGTATTINVSTTNRYTQSAGVEYLVTVASTSAIAGWRETATQNFMGGSPGDGGFTFTCRFGPGTGVATATTRLFTGLRSSAVAATDVEPSSVTNIIGVGWDAADANIQFMTNDGSGTATKIDLGIPVPTVDRTSLYEIVISVVPNSTTISYTFTDLAQGGSVVTGSTSTDVPAANTLLASTGWMSVGGTNSVIGYKLNSVWVESNF